MWRHRETRTPFRQRHGGTGGEGILRRFTIGALLLAACGDIAVHELDDIRERPATDRFRPVSSAERFGFASPAAPPHGHGHAAPARPAYAFTTPDGWTEVAASSMRLLNFQVTRDPAASCYLAALPGPAGGLAANLNRWRAQMGLAPLRAEEIERLPREMLAGGDAVFVDFEGTFTGMGGVARDGFRMLGLVREGARETLFLKMTGPRATVAAERDSFLALAASLAEGASAPAPAPPPVEASAPSGGGDWTWRAPDGWERGAARSMRVVTFVPEGEATAECYVTVLPGAAGGVLPNLNRWRQQMGQPPLAAADVEKLETVTVLGAPAPLLEVTGTFRGMSGGSQDGAALLGVVRPLGGRVLFVKMTGPAGVVARERARFVAFCESLEAP